MAIPNDFQPLGVYQQFPVGTIVLYGKGRTKVMRDLNNDTNLAYAFTKQTIDGELYGVTFKNAEDCSYMFYQASILNWNADGITFDKVQNGSYMFYNHSSNLTLSDATFEKLTNGSSMFGGSSKNVYLPKATFENLTNASSMRYTSYAEFKVPEATFEKLTNATFAFECIKNFDLPKATFNSLVNSSNMTSNLQGTCEWSAATFKNVTNASSMFRGQTTSGSNFLTLSLPAATFESLSNFSNMGTQNVRITNLHSINMQNATTATNFLNNSKLDKESVRQIANTIKDWSGDVEVHQIGMGISKDLENDTDVLQYLETIRSKNWTISPLNFNQ